jgi:hypothetical protein
MNNTLKYGFKDYLGNTWSNNFVGTYNQFNKQVVKRDLLNLCDQSKAELEFYKDQRHKQFIQLCELSGGLG